MRPGPRRHPAGNARCRRRASASPPSRRRRHAMTCSPGDWELRRTSPRRAFGRSSELLPLLDPIRAFGVGDGNETNDAAVAAIPVPREKREGAALAGDLVYVAADVLDAEDAVLEQDAVDRFPFRKVILPVAASRPLLVFLGEVRMQRAVALRPDRGGERMVVGLGVVADHLHLLLDEPLTGRGYETGRPAEIVFAILVELVPAGVDDDDIARAHDLAGGLLQILISDLLPLLLRNRYDDPRAEEVRQRNLVDERRALHHMGGRIDMGGVVHAGRDALRQHT